MADYATLTPINVVTGFLGSGKTTLLARLLRAPELTDTAVLVNEFGEVGLDHQLLRGITESTLLLENGCVCCAVRGDLQQALRTLLSQRSRGEVPFFRRVVIETSGLADPVPVAYTLLAEPVIRHHFRLSNIVTTIDAVNGAAQLEGFAEAGKQAAVADRLILTKTDIADPAAVQALSAQLRRLNASAPLLEPAAIGPDGSQLLVDDIYERDGKMREISRWLEGSAASQQDAGPDAEHHAEEHGHSAGIHSFTLTFERPLDWSAFGIWATMLLNRHGADVLRMKGLLSVEGVPTPVLINAVQHIVHPPSHLDAWPDEDRRSRLIFIVRGLSHAAIERSLRAFNALVNPAQNR
jgi:G3E family GTPase